MIELRLRSAVLALLVAVAAACEPAPAPRMPGAASRAVPALRIEAGTSGNYPPLSLWTGFRPEGFAPELLEAFATSKKAEITWRKFTWPELATDLAKEHRFEVAADGITVRPERSVLGRFTVPIARGGAVLLLRRPAWLGGAPVKSRADVAALDRPELRLAVNQGGHLERVAKSLFHAATVTTIPDNAAVRAAFANGDADAALTNTFEAPRWSEGLPFAVESVGPLTKDITALWLRADRGDLEEELDEWLLREEANGRLDRLRIRTLGPSGGGATALPLDALLAATTERLALMPFVAAAKQRAGKAVEDAAQEERVIAAVADAVAAAATKHGTPAPPSSAIAAFFRAQIEAAKDVQAHATPGSGASTSFALDTELRPAIARITARMAFLVVRLPRGLGPASVIARAREDLGDTGLDNGRIEQLATALAGMSL